MGRRKVRDFGMDQYTLLYLKWITNKGLSMDNQQGIAQGTRLNVMWQPGWMRSLEENGYMYIYDWVSLLSTCTVITLLISYTPIQNKKFNNNFKKDIGRQQKIYIYKKEAIYFTNTQFLFKCSFFNHQYYIVNVHISHLILTTILWGENQIN